MINCNYFLLVFAFLLLHTYNISGQVKIKDKEFKKATEKVFNSYEDIDSICLNFYEGKPEFMIVYQKLGTIASSPYVNANAKFFYLNFAGDSVLLKEQLPQLHNMIFTDNSFSKVQKKNRTTEKYAVSIAKESVSMGARRMFGHVYAELKRNSVNELTGMLNAGYHDSLLSNFKDSIIIVQTVVSQIGSVEYTELVYGNSPSLYHFFFKIFGPYSQNRIFEPFINSGTPRKSIVDIFIKIKPDHTFEIAGNGCHRVLRLKNYPKKSSAPLYY